MKNITFLIVAIILLPALASAQKTWVGGAAGAWNDGANWSGGTAPTTTDDVVFDNQTVVVSFTANPGTIQSLTLQNGADITLIETGATARTLELANNGTALLINSGCTLVIEGDGENMTLDFGGALTNEVATISGTLRTVGTGAVGGRFNTTSSTTSFTATGIYEHARNGYNIPIATWDVASTCLITGITASGPNNASLNQTFGNLTWNCPGQTTNDNLNVATVVSGTLSILSTGTSALAVPSAGAVTVGELNMPGGTLQLTGASTLSVSGNVTISGGLLNISPGAGANTLFIGGNLTIIGGQLTRSSNVAIVNFNGTSNQVLNIVGGSITGEVDFEVSSGSEISFATPATAIVGDGDFTLAGGAKLNIKSPAGISATGATGHIQVSGVRTFDIDANYFYQAAGPSISGTGLPAVVNELTVASGTTLELSNSVAVIGTFTNNGEVIFRNEVALNSTSAIAGTGNVTLRRDLSTSHTWYRLGFATTTGTVADLVANFPIRTTTTHANSSFWNVYRWDAATADWDACASTQPLNGTALSIYAFGSGLYVQITRPNADLNQATLAQGLNYNNGQSSSYLSGAVSVTEGWNMHYNPFQSFLDWDLVEPSLAGPTFTNSGVAVQNNLGNYEYYNASVGTARYIAPFQSFFIQTSSGGAYPTTLSYTNFMRTATPGAPVSSFKTSPSNNFTLTATGLGGDVKTHFAENSSATSGYEGGYDMRWFEGAGAEFYALDANGNQYGIYQSNVLTNTLVPVVFSHPTNGAQFSISADLSQWDPAIRVFLRDNFLNKKVRLTNKTVYSFTNNTAISGTRFTVSFVNTTVSKTDIEQSEEGITAWFTHNTLNLFSEGAVANGVVEVYNIAGQRLASQSFETLDSINLEIAATGVMIVRVAFEDGTFETIKVAKF
jgi:hypothetical protein